MHPFADGLAAYIRTMNCRPQMARSLRGPPVTDHDFLTVKCTDHPVRPEGTAHNEKENLRHILLVSLTPDSHNERTCREKHP